MLSGDNGILQRATDAKKQTERSSIIESAKTDILGQIAENKGDDISDTQFKEILKKYFKEESIPDDFPDDLSTLKLNTLNGNYEILASELYDGTLKTLSPGLYLAGTDTLIMPWKDLVNPDNKMLSLNGTTLSRSLFDTGEIADGKNVKLIVAKGTTTIGSMAGISQLEEIILPSTVNDIINPGFASCINLKSISIPAGNITNTTFGGCTNLKSVELKKGTIGERALMNFSNLETVKLGNEVTSIGNNAFSMSGIKEIEIPSSVTNIGTGIFSGCTNLESVKIEASGNLDSRLFAGCSSLKYVYLGENLILPSIGISFGPGQGCNKIETAIILSSGIISSGCFADNENLTTIELGNRITEIKNSAFQNCIKMTKIEIPSSVTKIGQNAFTGSGLTSITTPNSVISIEDGAFNGCSELTNAYIKSGDTRLWII